MSNFVNGYRNSAFRIIKNGTVYAQIELPETNEGGLTEKWTPIYKEHELWNNKIVRSLRGWRVTFTLDYTNYITKDSLMSVKQIVDFEKDGYDIYIFPRVDRLQRKFKVFFSGDEIDINIMRGEVYSKGNKSVELSWTAKDLIQDLDIIDPDNVQYTGMFVHPRCGVINS
jgi:hypothetical protein